MSVVKGKLSINVSSGTGKTYFLLGLLFKLLPNLHSSNNYGHRIRKPLNGFFTKNYDSDNANRSDVLNLEKNIEDLPMHNKSSHSQLSAAVTDKRRTLIDRFIYKLVSTSMSIFVSKNQRIRLFGNEYSRDEITSYWFDNLKSIDSRSSQFIFAITRGIESKGIIKSNKINHMTSLTTSSLSEENSKKVTSLVSKYSSFQHDKSYRYKSISMLDR